MWSRIRRTWPALAAATVSLAAGCSGSSPLLGPDAAQGIEGLVLLGPQCPVVRQGESCPDLPYQAWIRILDGDGNRVARIRSGQDGRFTVGLEPGPYTVSPESGEPFPRAEDQDVVVVEGVYASVTVRYDTGIR